MTKTSKLTGSLVKAGAFFIIMAVLFTGFKPFSALAALPQGYLDQGAGCNHIGGWAIDFDDTQAKVQIEIHIDGQNGPIVATTTADKSRSDIDTIYKVGFHAFGIVAPPEFSKDGLPHEAYAYAIDSDGSGAKFPLPESDGTRVVKICDTTAPATASVTINNLHAPAPVNSGASVEVEWTSDGTTSCTVYRGDALNTGSVFWSGGKGGYQALASNITSYTRFRISCTGGTAFDQASVDVKTTAPAPTATLECNGGAGYSTGSCTVPINTSAKLRWTSTNADDCSLYAGSFTGYTGKSMTDLPTGPVGGTTNYRLDCTGAGGKVSSAVTVNVSQVQVQVPTVSLTADNTNVNYNGSTTLRWYPSSNADSCNASGGTNNWAGSKSTASGSTFNTQSLTNTTTYTITCSNSAGTSAPASVTVSVGGVPSMSGTLTPSSSSCTIAAGANSCTTTTLTWHTTNPVSTSAVTSAIGSPSRVDGNDGARTFTAPYAPGGVFFFLHNNGVKLAEARVDTSCASGTNWNGSFCQTNSVDDPTVTLTADNTNIDFNQSTTLRWSSTNVTATSCSTSGGANGWSGSKPKSGTFDTQALTNTTTYYITCTNSNGKSASASVTVNVGNHNNNVTVNIRADDTSISSGDTTKVRWDSNNADYCNTTNGDSNWPQTHRGTSGTYTTKSLTSDKTYRITCFNNDGDSANDSVTVNVDDNNNSGPDVTTKSATNVTTSSATLRGEVDGNGSRTDVWFEWGTSKNNLNEETDQDSVGSGTDSFDARISGLRRDTTYYFRAMAENNEGSDEGSVLSFRTDGNDNIITDQQPTVTIYADQNDLSFNGATFIRWNTTNATSCNASGGSVGWAGAKSIGPGSFYTGSLTGSRTYTINCNNNVGSASDSVTVNVRGQVLGATTTRVVAPPPTSLVLITSSVDRNQPIVPTLDNTKPCPGDEINYAVTYQNIGTGSITGLTLRVDLPSEVSYMFSNPNNPIIAGNTLLFNLGTLRANGQGTVTVRVRVRDNVPAGTPLNFPAVLSYVDPSGFPQSVAANVSASVCGIVGVVAGANAFKAGFLPTNLFGWLLLIILILILIALARYLFGQMGRERIVYVNTPPPHL